MTVRPRTAPVLRVESFPPVVNRAARILILGTMPGAASLRAQQYYAHPRNVFWRLVARTSGVPAEAPYPERIAGLQRSGLALWDVLASCHRPGSLDASIDLASAVPHELPALLERHPGIVRVCCNGAIARTCLRRHFGGWLAAHPTLDIRVLPSTSPANASWTLSEKLLAWEEALRLPERG